MTLEEQLAQYKLLNEVKTSLIKAQDEQIENLKKMLRNSRIFV